MRAETIKTDEGKFESDSRDRTDIKTSVLLPWPIKYQVLFRCYCESTAPQSSRRHSLHYNTAASTLL